MKKITCYHPLKAFPKGHTPKGKIDYKIVGYHVDHIEFYGGHWHDAYSSNTSKYCEKIEREFIEIPCGRCIGCRLDYSRQWADRCMLEMKYHDDNYFVTLTYDDAHLPMSELVVEDTGELIRVPSLSKRDFQLFMKSLRKAYNEKYGQKLRFFMAGEYGGQTMRPHYHAIIFGLKLEDLTFYKRVDKYTYYNSKFLSDIWKKGFVVVAPACWETCAYTARYIMKKQKGESASIYDDFGIQEEFTLMSRKPGIGRQYFDDHGAEIFDTDCIYVSTPDGSKNIRPPRYYKKLLDIIDPVRYIELSEAGVFMQQNSSFQKLQQTSNSYLEMLAVEENAKKASVKALKRNSL